MSAVLKYLPDYKSTVNNKEEQVMGYTGYGYDPEKEGEDLPTGPAEE